MSLIDNLKSASPEQLEAEALEREKLRLRRNARAKQEVQSELYAPRVFQLHQGEAIRAIAIPQALVAGRFVANSLAFTMGEPGVGKTFFEVSLAAHIATGQSSWLGATIPQALRGRNVVYALAEGVGMFKVRLLGALQHVTGDARVLIPDSFIFLPQSLQVEDPRSIKSFVEHVRPLNPCLVIIDTYQRHGGPETEEERVSRTIENLTYIKDQLGCTVNAVHHLPKDGRQTPRGHGAIDGSIDTAVYLTRQQAGEIAVRFEQRDLEPSTLFAETKVFQVEGCLNPDNGDPMTTLIFQECSKPQAHRAAKSNSKTETLKNAILAEVRMNPLITQDALCKAVGGNRAAAIAEIAKLVAIGELRDSPTPGKAGRDVHRFEIGVSIF